MFALADAPWGLAVIAFVTLALTWRRSRRIRIAGVALAALALAVALSIAQAAWYPTTWVGPR